MFSQADDGKTEKGTQSWEKQVLSSGQLTATWSTSAVGIKGWIVSLAQIHVLKS